MARLVRIACCLWVLLACGVVVMVQLDDDPTNDLVGAGHGLWGIVSVVGTHRGPRPPEEEDMPGFGQYFRDARARAQLGLREAAREIGITEDGLSKIERNENGASLATMVRMAAVYGCQVGDLLPHSDAPPLLDQVRGLLLILEGLDESSRALVLASVTTQAQLMADLHRGD